MTRYLALYMGSAENADSTPPDAESQQKGMAAWGEWAASHNAAIVDQGAPLGKTKRMDTNGLSTTSNLITGYVLVEAASHEEAARIFERHPHFAVFSEKNSVEIIECLEVPSA